MDLINLVPVIDWFAIRLIPLYVLGGLASFGAGFVTCYILLRVRVEIEEE